MNRNLFIFSILGASLVACNAPVSPGLSSTTQKGEAAATRAIAANCTGGEKICIGIKYVVYRDTSGTPVATQSIAESNIQTTNQIWSTCGIAFQLETFEESDPRDSGLTFGGSASASETTRIRKDFQEDDSFLVVTTGAWGTKKNAWTEPPSGSGAYGVVMEASVAENGNILAHELGHYLSLDHVSDTHDVMSAIIYTNSTGLTESECAMARATATEYWAQMLR